MFLSSFVLGFEKPTFKTSYNASTIRDTLCNIDSKHLLVPRHGG
jgi:hypothetical protein